MKLIDCLLPWLSQPNLGQIKLSGTVLEPSGQADSKTVPGFDNWPRFVGVIEQNKIQRTYEHDCIVGPCLYNISTSGDFVLLINFRMAMDSSAAMSL